MKLNLYDICDEKLNKASIKVVLNKELKTKLNKSVEVLKTKVTFKELSNRLNVKYCSLWRYLNSNSIPLLLLKTIEDQTKIKFQEKIKELEVRKEKIKVVDKINENLAKIMGTIIADGHLRKRKSARGFHYELIVREEYKSNLNALSNWIYNIFKIKTTPIKKDNHYFIYISNKIVFNFFNLVIKIPKGNKSGIVTVPESIKKSNLEIKKAFLQGIFMFDGGVEYRTGYVDLISKSQKLIEGVLKILKEIGLEPDFIGLKPDKFGRYKIRFRKKSKLIRCIQLFQKNTEKWFRLNEHLYGLNSTTKNLKIAIRQFDLIYPKKRKSSVTFSDIIKIIQRLKEANLNEVSKELKRNKTVTYEYLKKLENWKILISKRKALKKIYKFNKLLKIPRRKILNGRKNCR